MKKIKTGIYGIDQTVEPTMPCEPKDIQFMCYGLPGTSLGSELEEAAARILIFSKEMNEWVGVSWTRLLQMLKEDLSPNKSTEMISRLNIEEEIRVASRLLNYKIFCFLTLGIYMLFAKRPKANLHEVPKKKTIYTGIKVYGPQHVANGIQGLLNKKLLKVVSVRDKNNDFQVLVPTPLLVSTIMQKQGVSQLK